MKTIEQMRRYVQEAIDAFKHDRPSTDFQKGYLAALEEVRKEMQRA